MYSTSNIDKITYEGIILDERLEFKDIPIIWR